MVIVPNVLFVRKNRFVALLVSTVYCCYRKRKQMAAANNSRPVLEKQLFHGTSAESIDPICRNGFDWRLCGTHGTMYGQGW